MSTVVAVTDWRRQLESKVKRLRVTATSDPTRAPELADALMQLTAVRLQAWAFAEAAADAPESVVVAARLLAAGGPVGPYASREDAARYFTATAQLATVQACLGLGEAAERTLAGLDAWRDQLGELPLLGSLAPETVVWTLLARARAATDPGAANSLAEAAAAHRYLAPITPNQAAAVHLLLADCRWLAGRPDAALAQHRLAIAELDRLVAELPERPRPGVAQVVADIAAASYEPYAARLEATGRCDLSLAVRREQLAAAQRFGGPAPESALAAALLRAGRAAEAAAIDPAATAGEPPAGPPAAGADWARLDAAGALAGRDLEPGYATAAAAEQHALAAGGPALAAAAASEARRREQWDAAARAEAAAKAEAEARQAAQAAQHAAEAAAREQELEAAAAARRAEASAAARLEAEARRQELAAAHEAGLPPEAAAAAEAELQAARQAAGGRPADPAARLKALETLAAALRPLAFRENERGELATALEELVALHWQLGNPEASREAARELKSLVK